MAGDIRTGQGSTLRACGDQLCAVRMGQTAGSLNKHKVCRSVRFDEYIENTFDVIIDLRKNSKTFRKWFGVELSSQNCKMLYIPEGFAHGFQTLEDNTEVFYQISKDHMPEYARGKLYCDPIFNILWPIKSIIISEKDQQWLPESN